MIVRIQMTLLTLLAGGAMLLPSAARADDRNKETILTFRRPVEVPGRVLAAGTYVFRLEDSESNRGIVQIFTDDRKQLLATIVAVPDYRVQTDDTVVTLEERPAGSPEAIHSWFYPGVNQGLRFVYPPAEK
jgi:hypothetical protein